MIGDYDFPKSDFTRAMLTGLFIGFIATIICLAYNMIYRESTGFSPSDFINVSSLIFAVNLLFWVLGIIYYLFFKYFRKGDTLFFVVFVLLVTYCIWKSAEVNRSTIHLENMQFRGLLLGIVIILGIGTLLIPIAFHNKKFEREVL